MSCQIENGGWFGLWPTSKDVDAFVQCHRRELEEETKAVKTEVARLSAVGPTENAGNGVALEDFEAIKTEVERLGKCTSLVHGVHLCREPMYAKTVAPFHLTPSTLFHPATDFCLKVETLHDVFPYISLNALNAIGFGTLDVPDNYLCIAKDSAEQYVDAFVPEHDQRYMTETGSWERPRCAFHCLDFTCAEITQGLHHKNENVTSGSGGGVQADKGPNDSKENCGACFSSQYKCKPYARSEDGE